MGKVIGTSYKGTLTAPGVRQQFIDELNINLSNAKDSWTLFANVSATRKIYHNTTLDNDASIYIEMDSSAIDRFSIYTHSDVADTPLAVGRQNTTTEANNRVLIDDTIDLDYWMHISGYEIVCIFKQVGAPGGDWHGFIAGQPARVHIPSSKRGVCRTTTISGTGPNVTISIDRNMAGSLQVGQQIWLIDQTPSGSALLADHIEVTTIQSMTSSGITFANIAGAFQANALVGLDPQNVGSCGSDGVSGLGDRVYISNRADGSYVVDSFATMQTLAGNAGDALNTFGIVDLFHPTLTDTNLAAQVWRGMWEHLTIFNDTVPVLTPEDIYKPNDNPSVGFIIQNLGPAIAATQWWACRTDPTL